MWWKLVSRYPRTLPCSASIRPPPRLHKSPRDLLEPARTIRAGRQTLPIDRRVARREVFPLELPPVTYLQLSEPAYSKVEKTTSRTMIMVNRTSS